MKNKKGEALIILFTGLLLIFFGWFVYAVYEPMTNTDSPRLKDLNRLIHFIGQIPSAIIFAAIGFFVCVYALKKFRN